LDTEGTLYTTGSSEYGQLANGETGEYFVSANKLAFANCQVFTARRVFVHAPGEKLHTSNEHCKTTPLPDSGTVRLAGIACGKHHGVAVERASDGAKPRVFSWGCGNYGCLGHGVQADEYHPRLIGVSTTLPLSAADGEDLLVSAGAHCSLLQTPSGHVYYWGKHRSVGEAVMRPQLVDALANNGHVVTHCGAGGQTVVCCTTSCVVAWGQGPHGELGLGDKKSSAKPAFVPSLEGRSFLDVACGYGHTLFVIKDVKDLPKLEANDAKDLEEKQPSKKGK
jgi:alpha-tubulin suppressor-like RCC1 family protein